jgi:hypothetical protein
LLTLALANQSDGFLIFGEHQHQPYKEANSEVGGAFFHSELTELLLVTIGASTLLPLMGFNFLSLALLSAGHSASVGVCAVLD